MSVRMAALTAAWLLSACAAGGPEAGPGRQAATSGEAVYLQLCSKCHSIARPDGETVVAGGRIGPNHWGVIGRQAGTQDFAAYGPDLVAAGARGLVWSEAEVVRYLEDPRGYLRAALADGDARSRMAFRLADEQARRDVAAYLGGLR